MNEYTVHLTEESKSLAVKAYGRFNFICRTWVDFSGTYLIRNVQQIWFIHRCKELLLYARHLTVHTMWTFFFTVFVCIWTVQSKRVCISCLLFYYGAPWNTASQTLYRQFVNWRFTDTQFLTDNLSVNNSTIVNSLTVNSSTDNSWIIWQHSIHWQSISWQTIR